MNYSKSVKFIEKFALNEANIKAIEQPCKIISKYLLNTLYLKNKPEVDYSFEQDMNLKGRFYLDFGYFINSIRESYCNNIITLKDAESIIKLIEKVQKPSLYAEFRKLYKNADSEKADYYDKSIKHLLDNIINNFKLYEEENIKFRRLRKSEYDIIYNKVKEIELIKKIL